VTNRGVILGALALTFGAMARADDPKPDPNKLPFQRMLTGADAKKAADLERQVDELEAADKLAEALTKAEELLTLREKLQGKDHWQVQNVRLVIDDLRRPLTAEQKEKLDTAQRLNDRAETLYKSGKSRDAIPVAEKALALAGQVYGNEHRTIIESLNLLTILHSAEKKLADAERTSKDALRICRKVYGEEHPETIICTNALALVYYEQAKFVDAEPLFRDILHVCRKVHGDEHRGTFSALKNLAHLYDTRGKSADAEPLYKEILQVNRKVHGDHSRTLHSLNDLAFVYDAQKKFAEAEQVLTDALRICRKLHGDEHSETATSLNNLAGAYRGQGKFIDAERWAKDALRIRRKAFGAEHPATATALNNLAGIYQEWGKFAAAEPLYLEAIRVHRKVHGPEHPNTAISLSNLARMYRDQGMFADAEPLLRDALRVHRKAFGDDHPVTAASLNNLASVCSARGKFADAQPLYEDALRAHRTLYGDDHPRTAHSRHELAAHFYAQGKFAEAEALYKEALRVFRKVYGAEHPDTATTLNGLAGLHKAQSKFADAEALYKEALRVYRKVLGVHPSTATSLNGLASLYHVRGKFTEAEPLYKEALRIFGGTLGDECRETAGSLNGLAELYSAQGKFAEAEVLYKEALRVHRKVHGDDHPFTAKSLSGLAALGRTRGKFAEAEVLYKEALRMYRKVHGDDHPDTAASLNNLANFYRDQGKFADAEPLLREALRVYRAVYGDESPHTATGLSNLAGVYQDQGKFADAVALFKEGLRVHRKVFGADHPATASSLNNLAGVYHDQKEFAAAEPLYESALRVFRKVLGADHPDTLAGLNNLASVYRSQGRFAAAEPLFEEALQVYRKVYGDEHPSTFTCASNLARLREVQGKFADAERLYKEALKVCRKVYGDEHPNTAHCLHNLALLYYDWGKFADAEPLFASAATAYEASRLAADRGVDRALFGAYSTPYLTQAVNGVALGKPRLAFGALESELGRGLLDELVARGAPVLTPDEVALRDRLTEQLGEIRGRVLTLAARHEPTAAERKELEALTAERSRLMGRLASLAGTVNRRAVADLEAIQKALPRDAAWVAWVDLTDPIGRLEEHWVCVVRSTGDPQWERLPGSGEKRKWVRADDDLPLRLRFAVTGHTNTPPAALADVMKLAKQVHAQRLAPAAKHLDGVKTLYVVAINLMAGVPVELLAPEYTVSYVPSATFLVRSGERPKTAATGALAVGDPIFNRPSANRSLPPGGLLITNMAADGAAARANLRPGDVLLKYGDVELTDANTLQKAIDAHADRKTVPVLVWRESADKPFVRDIAPGRLGVVLSTDPAPVALANRRRLDSALATRGNWNELPGTRVEADGLSKLFGARATVLTGSNASEQKLDDLRRAGDLMNYRYLHLATHGAGNMARALESYLVLAQGKLPDDPLANAGGPRLDGFLTAREVRDGWKLDAELVTLSACETAIGQYGGGDGLLGFAQAFLAVGSRAVCLSLWRVDDTATALLMDRFYRNLLGARDGLKGPMGKAAALAEAKAWLRELSSDEVLKHTAALTKGVVRGPGQKALQLEPPKVENGQKGVKPFAHPRYWAAFILVGEPN
jgi:tetratricopeptide (TPR) repeat protein